METGLLHLHSLLRWLTVIFLVTAIVKSLIGWLGKKEYKKSDNIIAIILVSFVHTQALVGIAVYLTSSMVKAGLANMGETMKNEGLRFWTVEHIIIMLGVVVLITIGRAKSKKATTDLLKHKKGAIFYIIAFIFILWAGIIKPLALSRGWF